MKNKRVVIADPQLHFSKKAPPSDLRRSAPTPDYSRAKTKSIYPFRIVNIEIIMNFDYLVVFGMWCCYNFVLFVMTTVYWLSLFSCPGTLELDGTNPISIHATPIVRPAECDVALFDTLIFAAEVSMLRRLSISLFIVFALLSRL